MDMVFAHSRKMCNCQGGVRWLWFARHILKDYLMGKIIQLVFGLFFLTLLGGAIFLAVAQPPVVQSEIVKPVPAERFNG